MTTPTTMTPPYTLSRWALARGVRVNATALDERPDGLMDDMPPGSRHWRLILTRPGNRSRMQLYWSQGPALQGPPDAATVLDILASESGTVEDCADAWDMADEYGMDRDTAAECRAVERTWRAMVRQRDSFRRFCADEYERVLVLERDA